MRKLLLLTLSLLTLTASAQKADSLQTDSLRIDFAQTELLQTDTLRIDSLQSDTLQADTPAKEGVLRKILRGFGKGVKELIRSFDRYDKNYIEPNHYEWTLMVQNTNFLQIIGIRAKGSDGVRRTINFSPRPAYKIGPYFGWRWLFLGYTIDISRPGKASKMTEFGLSLYSNMIGGDFVFVKNKGDFRIGSVYGFDNVKRNEFSGTAFSGLTTYTVSANAYYVFNHKKFSYPAAYNQSTVQKRSAGSFILGFRYDRQRIRFDYEKLPNALKLGDGIESNLDFKTLSYHSYMLNAGYAYNWVPARNLLLAISLTPAIGYKRQSGEGFSGQRVLDNISRINFDFIGRAGIVWNNGNYFAGASLISQLYDYHRDQLSVANSVNYLNFYAGLYFGLKKKYRKTE